MDASVQWRVLVLSSVRASVMTLVLPRRYRASSGTVHRPYVAHGNLLTRETETVVQPLREDLRVTKRRKPSVNAAAILAAANHVARRVADADVEPIFRAIEVFADLNVFHGSSIAEAVLRVKRNRSQLVQGGGQVAPRAPLGRVHCVFPGFRLP